MLATETQGGLVVHTPDTQNPADIVLRPLNILEVSFGLNESHIVCYAVIKKKDYHNLMLMNLVTGNPTVEFPEGTTIGRLASIMKYGKPVGFYDKVKDKAERINRVELKLSGGG